MGSGPHNRPGRAGVREFLRTLGMVALILGVVLPLVINCSNQMTPDERYILYMVTISMGLAEPKEDQGMEQRMASAAGIEMQAVIEAGSLPEGSRIEVLWYPPEGASAFSFPAGQPLNPAGPPPFRFDEVVGSMVSLSYELVGKPGVVPVDTVEVLGPDETVTAASFAHDGSSATSAVPARSQGQASSDLWWKAQYWFQTYEGDFTSEYAGEIFPFVQGGDVFLAVHFPVPGDAASKGYALPAVQRGDVAPELALVDYRQPLESNRVATFPLVYAPERHGFLESYLPSRSGWRWMALEASKDPAVEPPSGLPIPKDRWEFAAELTLEFPGIDGSARDTEVELYLCYEGQEAPPGFEASASAARAVFGEAFRSYAGEGVTCGGPVALRLADSQGEFGAIPDPPFGIAEVGVAHVTPPARTQLQYILENYGSSDVTVDLEIASDRGNTWKAYGGDWSGAPDLGNPLGNRVTIPVNGGMEAWLVRDVASDEDDGMETVTLTVKDASDSTKSVWQTGTVWIGDWVAPPGGGETKVTGWLPVGVHNDGAHGSRWRTDLGILNGGASSTEVMVTVYGSDGEHSVTKTVAAGEQVIVQDLLGQIPYTGAGAVKVESGQPVVLTSRSYSQLADSATCFPGGTLGQFLDSSERLPVVEAGSFARIPQLVENSRFRTNIALSNVGATGAAATVELYDGAGTKLGSYDVSLQPGEFKQENRPFASKGGVTDLGAGSALVSVTSGKVVGYASVIDNTSNDPTTLPLIPAPKPGEPWDGGDTTAWIPVAVHGSGAHGSRWRTDLGLLNAGATGADATITLHASDGEHVLTKRVEAGAQVILEDIVGQIPYTGGGALVVEAPGFLIVTSRSYSQLADTASCFPGGTLGQFLGAADAPGILESGESGWIPQLVENDRFRTNIALTNIGSTDAQATVTLYDGTGRELASYGVSLQAGQWQQENRPFADKGGVTDLEAGYARVSVSAGMVTGYASVIDNTTNDPTTLPVVR